MNVIPLIRRVAALNIKNTRSAAYLQLKSRTYQSCTFPISSDTWNAIADVPSLQTDFNAAQRFYCQIPTNDECWNCKAQTEDTHFACSKCGKLQDITNKYDYFQLLSVPRKYDLNATKLTKVFRQLQTLVHPDKFSNKSEREQTNSAEWSSLINKAYKTLSNPMLRGQYLLKLQGEDMPNDNSSLNKVFLMEMMERNEEVEEAESKVELTEINNSIQKEIDNEIVQLTKLFSSDDLQNAKEKLVKMKYLLSIQSSIKTKLEKFLYR